MLDKLILELRKVSTPYRAEQSAKFFKTGKGEYGEGDVFIGVDMPTMRSIAKNYTSMSLKDLQTLLESKIHEYRMVALVILVNKYKKSKKEKFQKREIYNFYLKNTRNINNWDLVDISCPHIIGEFCLIEGPGILRDLAKSDHLWEKRVSIVSTLRLIKEKRYGETLAISDMLINDEHDLIHKAVGWMLREVGKKNKGVLELFLKERYKSMPRTMLRYAIEKFPEDERKKYLLGHI